MCTISHTVQWVCAKDEGVRRWRVEIESAPQDWPVLCNQLRMTATWQEMTAVWTCKCSVQLHFTCTWCTNLSKHGMSWAQILPEKANFFPKHMY